MKEAEINHKSRAAPAQSTVQHTLELTCDSSSQTAAVSSLF